MPDYVGVSGFLGGGVCCSDVEGCVFLFGVDGPFFGEVGVVDVVCVVAEVAFFVLGVDVVGPWPWGVGEFVFDDLLGYVFGG